MFLLLHNICNSQVKITWEYSKNLKKADVIIYNDGAKDILLPLDLKSLKPHFENECSMVDYEFPYPSFGLTLLVENEHEKMFGSIHNIEVSENNNFNRIVLERQEINNEYLDFIKKWDESNKISDLDFAKKNYYLYNNLVFIKSKQKIKFQIAVNFDNITNQKYIYYYYPIDWGKKIEVMLSTCIDSDTYNYLTERQKQELKKYEFFTGNLRSNIIVLNQ